ncbi:uncharacterized protein LOC117646550 isoform X2 [Thrips palmi]|uniref:Uncharacterized protein LOC117646550 isoform X2 n=1 Tax=Thrips palmi TaxID=161013 RepID=A0A6P8YTV1_THRPL|nr:uncharacterized protein LOC117646550 isoform X2 [Thrips palmi]
MPTVSSHDVLGPMTWGAGGNSRQRYFPQDSLDRSDARSGINSLLFEESGAAGACSAGGSVAAASEHAYSSNCHRNSLVSANGYYGFHQQHGTGAAVLDQDCSMDTDTSENNPPVAAVPAVPGPPCAFGGSPSAGAVGFCGGAQQAAAPQAAAPQAFPLGLAPQRVWNADPFRSHGHASAATRKRSMEARGLGLAQGQGAGGWRDQRDADADDMAGCGGKRTRPSLPSPSEEAHAAAMTMTDITGGVVRSENMCGGEMQLRILEDTDLAALETLLKHTHGCDYYNYETCDL